MRSPPGAQPILAQTLRFRQRDPSSPGTGDNRGGWLTGRENRTSLLRDPPDGCRTSLEAVLPDQALLRFAVQLAFHFNEPFDPTPLELRPEELVELEDPR